LTERNNINQKQNKIMNEQNNQAGYLLLLSGKEWYKGLSPEKLQEAALQFKAWYDKLGEQGRIKGGQALVRAGATISAKNGKTVVADGPFAESKEAIGGFLLLQADTLEEAIAIAKTNPALAQGATIEVRPVAEECPMQSYLRQHSAEQQLVGA
jgi:hypothetical protein